MSNTRIFLFYWKLLRFPLLVGLVVNASIFFYHYFSKLPFPFESINIPLFLYVGYTLGKKHGGPISKSLGAGFLSGVILGVWSEFLNFFFYPERINLFGYSVVFLLLFYSGFIGLLFTTFPSMIFFLFKKKKAPLSKV